MVVVMVWGKHGTALSFPPNTHRETGTLRACCSLMPPRSKVSASTALL